MELRNLLQDNQDNGNCLVVSDTISAREIPSRIAAEEKGENRLLIFENISDFDGSVASNLFGNPDRIHRAMGVDGSPSFYQKIDQATQSPQELNIQGKDDDDYDVITDPVLLDQIPNIIHSEHDSTPYITSGVVLAKNPNTGLHHVSYIRLSVLDGNKFFFNPRTPRMKEIAEITLGEGKPMEIAVLIGGPVEIMLLGALAVDETQDELKIAQALGGGGLAFTDGDLPVPLGTEMVLFGTVNPDEIGDEGPFGDMKGLYMTNENPICTVREMWRRTDVNYHSILGGKSQEHVGLVRLRMMHQLEHLKATLPYFLDYHLPKYAAGQMCLITLEDGYSSANVDRSMFDIRLIEAFVLLNKDTDARSPEDVLWAITHRASTQDDLAVVETENIFGRPGYTVIDATTEDTKKWTSIRVKVFE